MPFDPLPHARASLVGAEQHEPSDQERGPWWRRISNTVVSVRHEFKAMAWALVAIAERLDKLLERDERPSEDEPRSPNRETAQEEPRP